MTKEQKYGIYVYLLSNLVFDAMEKAIPEAIKTGLNVREIRELNILTLKQIIRNAPEIDEQGEILPEEKP